VNTVCIQKNKTETKDLFSWIHTVQRVNVILCNLAHSLGTIPLYIHYQVNQSNFIFSVTFFSIYHV